MRKEPDPRLDRIVRPLAAAEGYGVAETGFIRTKELSAKWRFSGTSLYLYISDYLSDAPDAVLEQYVAGCIAFIAGRKPVFGHEYTDYMSSDVFLLAKRPVYIQRARNLRMNDVGTHHALSDSVQRLLDRGLLVPSDIDNTVFTWTSEPNYRRLGYCSQLMRVVAISSVMDDPDVPERTLDYVVYHECMHLRQGYRPFDTHPHDAAFRREIAKFPGAAEAEKDLNMFSARKGKAASRGRRSGTE